MKKKQVRRVRKAPAPIDTTGEGPGTPELALAGHAVQGLLRDLEALRDELRRGRVRDATDVQERLQTSWIRWYGGYQALCIELGRQASVLSREPLTTGTSAPPDDGD